MAPDCHPHTLPLRNSAGAMKNGQWVILGLGDVQLFAPCPPPPLPPQLSPLLFSPPSLPAPSRPWCPWSGRQP